MNPLWAVLDRTSPLLLKQPQLSLHPNAVRLIPQMFACIQSWTGHQILTTTDSVDLLRVPGIGLDRVLLFRPGAEGTVVEAAVRDEGARGGWWLAAGCNAGVCAAGAGG